MPRPRKCRRVCALPGCTQFAPADSAGADVVMSVDEYEAIRLIDHEGLTQEECAAQMDVARTTAQAIYAAARRKLAECIVLGRPLKITGGDVRLCDSGSACKHCPRVRNGADVPGKGEAEMRIAVTYEDGQVFQHFGHTKNFKLYDVEDGKIVSTAMLDAGESGHGALAVLLKDAGVDTLICGGIGGGARQELAKVSIDLYGGVSGSADAAAGDLVAGRLQFDPDATCTNHGEGHHHAEGEGCGGH